MPIENKAEISHVSSPHQSACGLHSTYQSAAVTVRLSTPGYVALIDLEDLGRVRQYSWHADITPWGPYARAYTPARKVSLHRFIMGTPKGVQIDHRNGDGLDCRKENLRPATQTQNNGNRKKGKRGTSSYKGVRLRSYGRWQAKIKCNGVQRSLGHFSDEESAARAYDAAAVEVFGEFARLNFPAEKAA